MAVIEGEIQPTGKAQAGSPKAASNGAAHAGNGKAPANGGSSAGLNVGVEEEHEQYERWQLVQRKPLEGGMLDIVAWEGGRMLRVWTPPGYSRMEGAREAYPVLYLNDGQNVFDDSLSFSGCSWRAGGAAAQLITTGRLPPFIVVGIDHAGERRAYDYTPYVPGTGPGGFRPDAADWPGGGVQHYLQRVLSEVVPFVVSQYYASEDAELMAFGGSSLGGICALAMGMTYPMRFGALLVESPSLWIGNEQFLNQDIAQYSGEWPQRVFLAMGGQEYSGIRKVKGPQWDALLANYAARLAGMLSGAGLCAERLSWQVDADATHTEAAWMKRLPAALTHLCSAWWQRIARDNENKLYFTTPRRVKAGQPMTLFFNARCSASLHASRTVRLCAGFNNWTEGKVEVVMQQCELPGSVSARWFHAALSVPDNAFEMNFVFADNDKTLWDNNDGNNFYCRVREHVTTRTSGLSPAELLRAAAAEAAEPPTGLAARNSRSLWFTAPQALVAGAPAVLYFNRKQTHTPLNSSPNIKVHFGFNNWTLSSCVSDLKPTQLWRDGQQDWWAAPLGGAEGLPRAAQEMNFAFSDGGQHWDNNGTHNFSAPVKQVDTQNMGSARCIADVQSMQHGAGTLHIITLTKREGGAAATRAARWTEEKVLRVWTPPGYDAARAPEGGWPVLYMNDGQNKFEDWLAHQGVSWRLGYTASDLITSKQLPPFVICAIDSIGPMRSLNYLPYPPGTGAGGFRGDAERWPGGGVDAYMHRVVEEIMPLISQRYATSTDPARVAFGGGSFGGVCALYAAMKYPHVFGAVLAESPSLWIAEARFLGDMDAYNGMLPERLFMGCGTAEYSATRDHSRPEVDAQLLHYYCEAARILQDKGMRGERLRFLVEEGAGHHELAWQWRLTGALQFLLSPWWHV